ncbi:MAG: cupin domain-containing protein [Planctomycetota bacterium]
MKSGNTDNIIGKISGLNALLNYQTGAVVSRAIITKPAGTVTIFAFDKGQGLSEHTAPFDALVYILDGTVRITISDRPFRLGKGQMIILPANKTHALKSITRFKMLLVMIKA